MSIKKFFDGSDKSRQYLTDQEQREAFKEVESSENLKQIKLKQDSHLPQVDYTNPDNFAKFGSAYLYYGSAIDRVLDYYPYDGSDAELNAFYNKSLPIEKYIFNHLYPRTNGYITFCTGGWGSRSGVLTIDGYGLPTTAEYITFYGGPNISTSLTKLKDMEPDPLSSKFQSNNIYDESIYDTAGLRSDYGKGTRESNLKSNFDTGVTVEFWLKTGSLNVTDTTRKQVVFDMWNSETSSSADYGRITIELTGGAGSGNPILLTAQSGTVSASAQMCFTSSIGQNLSSGDFSSWRHYAITMYNSGSDFKADLYVNGYLNDTNTYTGGKLGELNSKNMIGRLGALVATPSGSTAEAKSGKLSGSLDEFRFWKVRRDGAQIGKNWFDQIRGGVNTDISNTELGMYYKFNEGITGDSEIDSVVLDYGGRLCNGVWTGYTTTSRNTGSAILSSSAATKEYEDPIIHSAHPQVSSLKEALLSSGSFHDGRNAALVRNLVPSWITEDMEISEQSDLDKLCHIIGAYFDKLYLQIGGIPTFKHLNYTSASSEALPFAQHLPQSMGLYTPEIFVDSTILEKFKNRTDKEHFQSNLVEAKNLIYSNLYNNLASIFKAKGTERAIRNTLRCFNLNDTLITYNVYSNNQQYELKNSLKQTLKKKTYANFNTGDGITAVIHQAADPHTGSTRGYISGTNASGFEDKYGFTAEASIVFPRFYKQLDPFPRDFKNVSLFGVQTVNTASTSDTAFLTGAQDVSNFQVYAVRDSIGSKNAYFVLTSSTDPHNIPTLTSSMFFDVYDDSNWNFSVRVKPSNYGFTDLISGSHEYNYDVVFRGVNNNLGTVLNEFEVSSSVTKAVGQSIVRAPKRLYVGARNTNLTGANVYKSDILVSTAKYWTKYIDNVTLNQHLFDAENFGISGSYKHISMLDSNLQNTHNYDTLALNWYFGNVTSSDATGNFYVTDLSSGSAGNRASAGWIGNVGGHLHSAKGAGFYTNDSNVVKAKNVNEFKFVDPERAVGSDMVQIRSADDEIYGLTEQIPNYVYTIEKSLYAAVTEEILDFFAGAIDFHHLIGHPANRYRMQYKDMEHLRRVYFERVKDVSTVEKFTEYYKWFDDALSIIIGQLVPASADFVKDSYNTIESHVLERNKYKTQFPTIEFRSPDPEPPMRGVGEATWPWDASRSPPPSSPRSTKVRPEYWQKRAETTSPEITSGDATIDKQRQKFKEVIWSIPNLSKSMPTLSNVAGVKYHRNQWLASQQNQTYFFDATFNRNIKGGVNFDPGKNIAFTYNSLAPAGPVNAPSGGVYVPLNILFADIEDLVKIQRLELSTSFWQHRGKPNEKVKRTIKVQAGRAFEEGGGYTTTKSTFSFPFNILSSSVVSGFNSGVVDRVTASIEITNLHNDVYGEDMERPMQSTWSEYAAGGHQSRHIGLNIYNSNKSDEYNGLDNYTTRPEAWKLLLGNCAGESGSIGMVAPDYPWPEANERDIAPYPMTASQKAVYYRDFTAKTPYVFKNIRMRTGSTILGNYRNNYELVQTVGTWQNPRQFIEDPPTLPPQLFAAPVHPRGTVTVAAEPAPGDALTVSDGIKSLTFSFVDDPAGSVGARRIKIYSDTDDQALYIAVTVLLACQAEGVKLGLSRTDSVVTFFNTAYGSRGNVPIVFTSAVNPNAIAVSGMSGGSRSPAFATQTRTFLDIRRGRALSGSSPAILSASRENIDPALELSGTTAGFQFVDEYSLSYLTGTENKSVFKARFSNPGGLEVNYRDFRSDEFSVYNATRYRNMTILKPSQGPRGTISEITGVGGPGIRVFDIHGLDYGLRSHLSRHTARFGRDSLIYTPDGLREPYSLTKPFIGYGDSKVYRAAGSLRAWWRLQISASNASYIPNRAATASVDYYPSLTGSWTTAAGTDIKHYQPIYNTSSAPSTYIQTSSLNFVSGDMAGATATGGSICIGSSTDWDPVIGNAAGSTQKFTLGARVYYNSGTMAADLNDGNLANPQKWPRIIDFGGDIWLLLNRVTWQYNFAVKHTSSVAQFNSPTGSAIPNTWQNIMVSYDPENMPGQPSLYIDGVSQSVSNSTGSYLGSYYGIATSYGCFIGNRDIAAGGDRSWSGSISDVAVWDSVLSADEAAAWHNASRGPRETSDTQFWGPGRDSSLKYPGYHKVHRNNLPRLKYKTREYGQQQVNYNTGAVKEHIMTWYNTDVPVAKDLKLYNSGSVKNAAGSATTGSHWTLVAWFNYGNNPGNTRGLIHLGLDDSSANASALCWNLQGSNRRMDLNVKTDQSATRGKWTWADGVQIQDDNWYHLAVTYNGDDPANDPTFYVDGVAQVTKETTTPGNSMVSVNTVESGQSVIGAGSIGGTGGEIIPLKDAHLAEVAIYDAVLDASEIAQIYNNATLLNLTHSTIAPKVDNLITWLRMGDTKGVAGNEHLYDLSGSNTALSRSCPNGAEDEGRPHTVYDVRGNNHYALWGNISNANVDASSSFYSQTSNADPFFTGGYGAVYGGWAAFESSTYESSSHYDNFYVQHQIPRSDKQYAWITGALYDPNNNPRYYGFMPVEGRNAGMFSSSYTNGPQAFFNFVSASEFGTFMYTTVRGMMTSRDLGLRMYNAGATDINPSSFIPAVSRLNFSIYEPITASDSTLGYPIQAPGTTEGPFGPADVGGGTVPALHTTNAKTQYRNTDTITSEIYVQPVRPEAPFFNLLMFKRNGQYGYGTFAQARQADHPIAYDQRQNNNLMVEYKTPGIPQKFDLRPVSMKGRPVTLNFDYETTQTLRNQVIAKTANATLKTSYNNEFIYFNSQSLDHHFDIDQVLKSEITPFEQLVHLRNKSGFTLNWVHYKECVFPSLKNEFSPTSSFRYGYDNKFWRKSRDTRKTSYSGTSSMFATRTRGAISDFFSSGSIWPLDAPYNFLSRSHAPWAQTFTSSVGSVVDDFRNRSLLAGGVNMRGPASEEGALDSDDHIYGNNSVPFSGDPVTDQDGNILIPAADNPNGAAGELQNVYGWWHQTSSNAINADGATAETWEYQFRTDGKYQEMVFASLFPGPLYARKHTMASPLSINPPNVPAVSCSVWMLGTSGGIKPAIAFSSYEKPSPDTAEYGFTTASIGAGEALWETGRTAGYLTRSADPNTGESVLGFVSAASEPWYDTYEDFKEHDLKFIGRGYSVVPEYRISEKLLDESDGAGADDFKSLSIPGTEFDSSDENFYIDFSNSDFMNKFLDIRRMSDLEAKEIKLTCNAVVKFNPYKGFYPAQRTLDLVSQFSRSYGNAIQCAHNMQDDIYGGTPGYTRVSTTMGITGSLARMVLQPLFAPGILYNSIKSGIACDWPVTTEGRKLRVDAFTASAASSDKALDVLNGINYAWYPNIGWGALYLSGAFFDKRIPFEAIINPGKHMGDMSLIDMEPHPLVNFRQAVTASIVGNPADTLYTRMASNFVAEVADFFLDGQSYSSLKSKGVSLGTQTFPKGVTYGARLRMRASYTGDRTYEFESGSHGNNRFFTKQGAGGVYVDASPISSLRFGHTTGSFEIPQDPNKSQTFERDFVMYDRTTAFGPPFTAIPSHQQFVANRVLNSVLYALPLTWLDTTGSPPASLLTGGVYPAPYRYFSGSTEWENGWEEWIENAMRMGATSHASGAMDCYNGYNWAYTPPYYHGEAWCDFIFRPQEGKEYTLKQIVSELSTSYWRADPGPQTSSFNMSFYNITKSGGASGTSPLAFDDVEINKYTNDLAAYQHLVYETGSWGYQYIGKIFPGPPLPGITFSSLINDHPGMRTTGSNSADTSRANTAGLNRHPGGAPLASNNSVYSSLNINKNAMHLSASLNLFGVENVYKRQYDKFGREILEETEVIGHRWVISPKFETPMMNFSKNQNNVRPVVGQGTSSAGTSLLPATLDARTKTVPTKTQGASTIVPAYGSDTAANGMWHQFGTLPERANQGIFLQMDDIPSNWLQYHYLCVSQSSIYNNFDPDSVGPRGVSTLNESMQSLGDLLGFDEESGQTRLGELAKKKVIKEAVVAVPYILKTQTVLTSPLPSGGAAGSATPEMAAVKTKQFINIPQNRFAAAMSAEEGSSSGDSLDTAGQSIRRLVDKMRDYILPPQFDFLNRPDSVEPVVMYIFEFSYELDRDDLSYIWQNLAPRDYERSSVQVDAVSHELFNTELLTEQNIMDNPNLRWMVFKVKQRSQKMYRDKVTKNYGAYVKPTAELDPDSDTARLRNVSSFNWPYDYLSIVELVKLEAEVLYRDDDIELDEMLISEGATIADVVSPEISGLAPRPFTQTGPPLVIDEGLKIAKKKALVGDVGAKSSVLIEKKKKRTTVKKKSGPIPGGLKGAAGTSAPKAKTGKKKLGKKKGGFTPKKY